MEGKRIIRAQEERLFTRPASRSRENAKKRMKETHTTILNLKELAIEKTAGSLKTSTSISPEVRHGRGPPNTNLPVGKRCKR